MKESYECIYCGNVIKGKNGKCSVCDVYLHDMIPTSKPKPEHKPEKSIFLSPLGLFIFWPIPLCIFLFLPYPFLILFLLLAFLYIICLLYYKHQLDKYDRYQREIKLYRSFVKSVEEENKENEEIQKQRHFEEMAEQRRKDYMKTKFQEQLQQTYGTEICRLGYNMLSYISSSPSDLYSSFLVLYDGYIVYCDEFKVIEEIDLSCYSDCVLHRNALQNIAFIILKDPSSQSKFDEFINGTRGKSFAVSPVKNCPESRVQDVNRFFNQLKKQMNK